MNKIERKPVKDELLYGLVAYDNNVINDIVYYVRNLFPEGQIIVHLYCGRLALDQITRESLKHYYAEIDSTGLTIGDIRLTTTHCVHFDDSSFISTAYRKEGGAVFPLSSYNIDVVIENGVHYRFYKPFQDVMNARLENRMKTDSQPETNLEKYEKLEHNWNNYGGLPVKKNVIDMMRPVIEDNPEIDKILTPDTEGGLAVEDELKTGRDRIGLSMDFNPDGTCGIYIWEENHYIDDIEVEFHGKWGEGLEILQVWMTNKELFRKIIHVYNWKKNGKEKGE